MINQEGAVSCDCRIGTPSAEVMYNEFECGFERIETRGREP